MYLFTTINHQVRWSSLSVLLSLAQTSGDVWKRITGEISSEQEQLRCVSVCVLYLVPSTVKSEKIVILIDMFHFYNGLDIYMTHLYLSSNLDTPVILGKCIYCNRRLILPFGQSTWSARISVCKGWFFFKKKTSFQLYSAFFSVCIVRHLRVCW